MISWICLPASARRIHRQYMHRFMLHVGCCINGVQDTETDTLAESFPLPGPDAILDIRRSPPRCDALGEPGGADEYVRGCVVPYVREA